MDFMRRKTDKMKKAILYRAKAKNYFLEVANNKKSKKEDIINAYKEYKKADDALLNIYEGLYKMPYKKNKGLDNEKVYKQCA